MSAWPGLGSLVDRWTGGLVSSGLVRVRAPDYAAASRYTCQRHNNTIVLQSTECTVLVV